MTPLKVSPRTRYLRVKRVGQSADLALALAFLGAAPAALAFLALAFLGAAALTLIEDFEDLAEADFAVLLGLGFAVDEGLLGVAARADFTEASWPRATPRAFSALATAAMAAVRWRAISFSFMDFT